MIVYAEEDQDLLFKFRSHIHNYRLRQNNKDKGERRNSQPMLSLKKNCHYFFDNFQ